MKLLYSIIIILLLFSCSNNDTYSSKQITEAEFKENLLDQGVRNFSLKKKKEKSIPQLSKIKIAKKPPTLSNNVLVSISITENMSLKDVFLELGRLANIEIAIDPNIQGKVILTTKNRPLLDVIKRITESANLRFKITDGILKIEQDTAFIKSYNVNFLDLNRKSNHSLSLSTKSSSEGLTSGGTTEISADSNGNIWEKMITNLKTIISSENGKRGFVNFSKKVGIVTISTNEKTHKIVKKYIDKVKRNATSQVLIEAKIVEVVLNDDFKTGIDWSAAVGSGSLVNLTQNISSNNPVSLIFSAKKSNKATINFLKEFGTTNTLSSPRIIALNNQQAILSFTENRVYFEVSFQSGTSVSNAATGSTNTTSTGPTINSVLKTVPIGTILALQPSIDLDKEEILLNIRPTISSSSSTVEDPAVNLAVASAISSSSASSNSTDIRQLNIKSEIPVVSLKELDTLLKLKSGDTTVIGGLIDHKTLKKETGVPFLRAIPILGYLFKSVSKIEQFTETVILLKATIVHSDGILSNSDKNFYKGFANDPSPLF